MKHITGERRKKPMDGQLTTLVSQITDQAMLDDFIRTVPPSIQAGTYRLIASLITRFTPRPEMVTPL